MEELKMQQKCFMWHQEVYYMERGWLRRVKNELDNHPRKSQADVYKQLSENKATGIVKGTWDMFYMRDPIIWFEAKIGKNILSPEQEAFRMRGIELGWMFFVFYTIDEFKNIMYELH